MKLIGIICLFAELFFAQLVQREELLGEHDVLLEAAAGQLHADDDCPVWNHHCHCAKVDLQVLRQFLPTCVAGILQTTGKFSRNYMHDYTQKYVFYQVL